MENRILCNCKSVSYFDVEDAMHEANSLSDVEKIFEDVQKLTHCSTGCGTCHDRILDAISEILHR